MSERKAPSARGLFRATGKAADVTSAKPLLTREPHDFYRTPPEATRALLAAEAARLAGFPVIWEPAAGDGAMVREIRAAGHTCVASDLVDRGCDAQVVDFFDLTAPLSDCIVTNPPYDRINARDGRGAWVSHALGTLGVHYMACLLNWNWFCAAGLDSILSRHGAARVYAVCWKLDFTGAGAPPMNSAWVVWDSSHQGPTQLLRMHRQDDARQAVLL